MTPTQAAIYVGCSVSHIRNLIRTRELPSTKVETHLTRNGETVWYYTLRLEDLDKLKASLDHQKPRRGRPVGSVRVNRFNDDGAQFRKREDR